MAGWKWRRAALEAGNWGWAAALCSSPTINPSRSPRRTPTGEALPLKGAPTLDSRGAPGVLPTAEQARLGGPAGGKVLLEGNAAPVPTRPTLGFATSLAEGAHPAGPSPGREVRGEAPAPGRGRKARLGAE